MVSAYILSHFEWIFRHRLRWGLKQFIFLHMDLEALQQHLLEIFPSPTEFLHHFCLEKVDTCAGPLLDCFLPSVCVSLSGHLSHFPLVFLLPPLCNCGKVVVT